MQDASDPHLTTINPSINKQRNEHTPLYSNSSDTGTLRLIVSFFFGFTVTLTAALAIQIYYGKPQIVPHGSVSSDSEICSKIGTAMIKQGGNAIDAAISTAFCLGVVNPHITGLGSGGFMLIYGHRERKVLDVIDFRATRGRHNGIGIPGFVAGMYLAHQLHGVLPWKTLIMPAHDIAMTGFTVSETLLEAGNYVSNRSHTIELQNWFRSLQLGDLTSNFELANTLLSIAELGPSAFYNKTLIDELGEFNDPASIINYEPLRSSSLKETFHNYDIIVPGQGSGGPLLLENLKHLNDSMTPLLSTVQAYSHIAKQWSTLSLASQLSAIDINDIYVSVVSGLGSILGSQILTQSGFILNNILELSPDKGERPTVLFTPVITLQNGNVCGRRLILGGGDVRDVAQALIYFWKNPNANVSRNTEQPRIRISTTIGIEKPLRISPSDYEALSSFNLQDAPSPYPSINVIQKVIDNVEAVADYRGHGKAISF